jgi:hypothetical protein
MQLVFLYGPVAAGKLTVARKLAEATGYALFHNHLVVDAVAAVFPFGSDDFVRLRERWWLDAFEAAAREGRSLIFTYAPEPSVAADFPERARALVEGLGGRVVFAALDIAVEEQRRRLTAPDRAAFGKLRSLATLEQFGPAMAACHAAMPEALVRIDAQTTPPGEAAMRIEAALRPAG